MTYSRGITKDKWLFAEKTVDWSQNPLEIKSEAREEFIDDDSDVEVFVWTSVGKLLASGAPAHLSKTLERNPRSSKGAS